MRTILLGVLVLLLGVRSGAVEIIPESLATLVETSDLIAIGVARPVEGTVVAVEVSNYLRGDGPRRFEMIEFTDNFAAGWGIRAFPHNELGVLFLKREGEDFLPAGNRAFAPISRLRYVETLMQVAKDPGPFLQDPRWLRNADFFELLGRRFRSLAVSSAEAPNVAEFLNDNRIDPFPWSIRDRAEFTFTNDPASPQIRGDGTPAGDSIAAILNAQATYLWPAVLRSPARFSVSFDTRRPDRFGSVRARQGVDILMNALRSTDRDIVGAATTALASMRADEAVPLVVPLLRSPNEDIARDAIRFLMLSRDSRGGTALTALVDKGAPESIRHAASIALRRCFDLPAPAARDLSCYY